MGNQFWVNLGVWWDGWEIIDVAVGQLCRSPAEPQSIIQHIVIVLSENTNTDSNYSQLLVDNKCESRKAKNLMFLLLKRN